MIFVVDVCFFVEMLDFNGVVIDIGCVYEVFKDVFGLFNYKNLDDVLEFEGINIIMEFLIKYVYDYLVGVVCKGELGCVFGELKVICVMIFEFYVVRVWYEVVV